jgi:hypothetical protein
MKRKIQLLVITLEILAGIHQAAAQDTAFTYQAQLSASGIPTSGNYDFTFALFTNNSTNSEQVGTTLTNFDVGVTNGLFTVTLDFGGIFAGANYWLAIGVQTNGSTNFTSLSPLQEVSPTPYAIYAATANSVSGTNATLNTLDVTNNAIIGGSVTASSFIGGSVTATSLTGKLVTPIQLPVWDTTMNMVADANRASVEYVTTGNLTFSYATNGQAGNEILTSIYLYGGMTNRALIFPANWIFFNCTATNTLLSNEWTAVHLRFRGVTTTTASQTNIMVKLEAQ